MSDNEDITGLLQQAARGNVEGLDRLVPVVYDELKRIAHRQLRSERSDHTLDTVALVHEAYLRLRGLERIEWRDRGHFFSAAASAMRRILVDYALARKAGKRGGGRRPVTLEDLPELAVEPSDQLLALDEALRQLDQVSPRAARIVEWRFFAGMSIEETASVLEISPATVKREWTLARAWLNRELAQ